MMQAAIFSNACTVVGYESPFMFGFLLRIGQSIGVRRMRIREPLTDSRLHIGQSGWPPLPNTIGRLQLRACADHTDPCSRSAATQLKPTTAGARLIVWEQTEVFLPRTRLNRVEADSNFSSHTFRLSQR